MPLYYRIFFLVSSSSLLFSVVDVAPEDNAGIRREKTLKRSTPPPHQKPWHDYDKPPTAAKNNNNKQVASGVESSSFASHGTHFRLLKRLNLLRCMRIRKQKNCLTE
jgi:hypothetical protein